MKQNAAAAADNNIIGLLYQPHTLAVIQAALFTSLSALRIATHCPTGTFVGGDTARKHTISAVRQRCKLVLIICVAKCSSVFAR